MKTHVLAADREVVNGCDSAADGDDDVMLASCCCVMMNLASSGREDVQRRGMERCKAWKRVGQGTGAEGSEARQSE